MLPRMPAILVITVSTTMPALPADLTVPIPPGVTPLADIGLYQVAYQSYGGARVDMPASWVGHFETNSGISYLPTERVLDHNSILLHSPWKIPPGRTFVEYTLKLPDIKPLTLSFGIAMRPDAVVAGHSDGVTYVVDEPCTVSGVGVLGFGGP